MLRKIVLCVAATSVLLTGLLLGVAAWMLYQPAGGAHTLYYSYEWVIAHDPAHTRFYARTLLRLEDVTDGNLQHYVAHRAAARLAEAVGWHDLARQQTYRAAQHAPVPTSP